MIAAAGALLGLGPRGSNIVASILGVLALCVAVYFTIDAYGDREFAAGQQTEKEVWLQAEENFEKKHETAKAEADVDAAAREAAHAAEVANEREKINEAIAEDRSPLDVVFPGSL
jgi:biopolymer transport protein ExbB/TolQ